MAGPAYCLLVRALQSYMQGGPRVPRYIPLSIAGYFFSPGAIVYDLLLSWDMDMHIQINLPVNNRYAC